MVGPDEVATFDPAPKRTELVCGDADPDVALWAPTQTLLSAAATRQLPRLPRSRGRRYATPSPRQRFAMVGVVAADSTDHTRRPPPPSE
ncbi:hypothetical protein D7147_09240 [Micromonospora musae]|uniref:Uncharacterized protein n=1 Tax=Micromonospora musae TaxID=1894970 RepID=A0ABX9RBQ1_9ACTN|nr:hypothetical protein D7147_09240 [Micromonospora musae]